VNELDLVFGRHSTRALALPPSSPKHLPKALPSVVERLDPRSIDRKFHRLIPSCRKIFRRAREFFDAPSSLPNVTRL
jgi:hypothetical protein